MYNSDVCSSTGGIQLYHFWTTFVPPTSRLFPVLPCQVILSGAATTKVCFPLHIARLLRVVYVRVEEYCTGNGKQNDVIFLVGMGQRYCLGGTLRHHVHSVSSNQFCEQHRAACMHLFIHERVDNFISFLLCRFDVCRACLCFSRLVQSLVLFLVVR
jgi:hypothetical protein